MNRGSYGGSVATPSVAVAARVRRLQREAAWPVRDGYEWASRTGPLSARERGEEVLEDEEEEQHDPRADVPHVDVVVEPDEDLHRMADP